MAKLGVLFLRKTGKAEVTPKRNPSPAPCVGSGDSSEAREESAQVEPKTVSGSTGKISRSALQRH